MTRIFILPVFSVFVLRQILAIDAPDEHFNSSRISQPFYVIAHQVNSPKHVDYFLSLGANGLEADIRFDSNSGEPFETYQGWNCKCCTECHERDELAHYFQHIRNLTFPSSEHYNPDLALLLLDTKISDLREDLYPEAGKKLAYKVLDNLMLDEEGNVNELKVVVSVEKAKMKQFFKTFIETVREREGRVLDFIYFDVWRWETISQLNELWKELNVGTNIFQGDGDDQCFQLVNSTYQARTNELLQNRETVHGYVYFWYRDTEIALNYLLNKKLDGIATNRPQLLKYLVNEKLKGE